MVVLLLFHSVFIINTSLVRMCLVSCLFQNLFQSFSWIREVLRYCTLCTLHVGYVVLMTNDTFYLNLVCATSSLVPMNFFYYRASTKNEKICASLVFQPQEKVKVSSIKTDYIDYPFINDCAVFFVIVNTSFDSGHLEIPYLLNCKQQKLPDLLTLESGKSGWINELIVMIEVWKNLVQKFS